jgi:penicillin-binding protein 1A
MSTEPIPEPAALTPPFPRQPGLRGLSRLFRRPRSLRGWIALAFVVGSLTVGGVVLFWLGKYTLAIRKLSQGVGDTVFLSADGWPWFRLDERRRDVDLQDISPFLRQAVVAIEDRRFYRHGGIDPVGVGRAAYRDVKNGRLSEGGSTITQQLARTLFLSNRRTLGRKAKEAVLALLLEAMLGKDQILELYLNRVYLSGGVYGVEAMSESLYQKRARDLTLPEAALIAGVIQAPSALSPWSNFEGAVERSHLVLARMKEEGFISDEQEAGARGVSLHITRHPMQADARSGYAKEYLRQLFQEAVGEDAPPDWRVETSFPREVQEAAERAVDNGLRRLARPGLQAALVALDPQTGDILALVGGADFAESPFNRAIKARRQPGSAFKPVVYAAALEKGLSPVSEIERTGVEAAGQDEEALDGLEEDEDRPLTLREALFTSNNRAAVALQAQIGTRAVLDLAKRMGLRDQPEVASLALGTGLATPLELATAYTAFPGGGSLAEPRAIARVLDANGALAFESSPSHRRVISDAVAFQAVSMLRDVVKRGTGSSARSLGFPVAGKTGTTDEFKDAWFVGFSSSMVVAVWVGFDQPETIGREGYGGRVALPIFVDFMRRTAGARPPRSFQPPPSVHEQELCRISYLRPVEACPTYLEYFKDGDSAPQGLCSIHQGSLKREAKRALSGVWRTLRRIFEHE